MTSTARPQQLELTLDLGLGLEFSDPLARETTASRERHDRAAALYAAPDEPAVPTDTEGAYQLGFADQQRGLRRAYLAPVACSTMERVNWIKAYSVGQQTAANLTAEQVGR